MPDQPALVARGARGGGPRRDQSALLKEAMVDQLAFVAEQARGSGELTRRGSSRKSA